MSDATNNRFYREPAPEPTPIYDPAVQCVVCGLTVRACDSGLCDDHKYDEQAR